MSIVTIEATVSGTITRACARTVNAHLRKANIAQLAVLSGSSLVAEVVADLDAWGIAYRVVDAASLKGADKGRHTREVNRSRDAQARREARKSALVRAVQAA